MGLLTTLLTLPVSVPMKVGWMAIEQVASAAEAELYDEDRIIAELRALTADVEANRISEEEHAAAEQALLERLMEARARRAAVDEEAP